MPVELPAVQLSPDALRSFGVDVFKGRVQAVIDRMEADGIDANSLIDRKKHVTILKKGVEGGRHNRTLPLVEYLLRQGADPNVADTSGYNAFHSAIFLRDLELCELFLAHDVNPDAQDAQGYSALFLFLRECYAHWAPRGVGLKQRCLAIVERLLAKGADGELASRYGTIPRTYLCPEIAAVRRLIEGTAVRSVAAYRQTPQPPSALRHPEIGKEIWKNLVPRRGQADSVQGELLRAVEKVRDEAQRNGNVNFNRCHTLLVAFVRDTLVASGLFDAETVLQIQRDTKLLVSPRRPYLQDDVYDRLCDRVCEFYLHHREPIHREPNPEITC